MKYNSKAILLLLYSPDNSEPVFLTERVFHIFLPLLTTSGLRSILSGLQKQNYISKHNLPRNAIYSLTSLGRSHCEAQFPALSNHSVDMKLLIFNRAPVSDKGFHYLRKCCLDSKAVLLSRGVYLFPIGISSSLEQVITKMYQKAVIVLKVSAIESGFEWQTLIESIELWDVVSIYSGISKELDELLINFNHDKMLIEKNKMQFSQLLKRLIESLLLDSGLARSSLLEEYQPLFILSRIQKLSQL